MNFSRRSWITFSILIALSLAGGVLAVRANRGEADTKPTRAPRQTESRPSTSSPKPSDAPSTTATGTALADTSGWTTATGAPAETYYTPKKRGPGAKLDFDEASAPLVPKGMNADKYVASYYDALIAKKWATAFKLVPPTDPGETLATFRSRQKGYEVSGFNILSAVPLETGISVLVVHITPSNGVWNVTWEFVKTARGLVLKDLTYARPGGAGCH